MICKVEQGLGQVMQGNGKAGRGVAQSGGKKMTIIIAALIGAMIGSAVGFTLAALLAAAKCRDCEMERERENDG